QYLFRHAEGRKSGARLLGGHLIGRLAHHFGLGMKRQPVDVAAALGGAEVALYVDEGAQAVSARYYAPSTTHLSWMEGLSLEIRGRLRRDDTWAMF
ncbi:hypothetical protein Tco_0170737, partial [Tanacetum coccineum]